MTNSLCSSPAVYGYQGFAISLEKNLPCFPLIFLVFSHFKVEVRFRDEGN